MNFNDFFDFLGNMDNGPVIFMLIICIAMVYLSCVWLISYNKAKKANREIQELYGFFETGDIVRENGVTIASKRIDKHPKNNAIQINIVVFSLADGTSLELAIQDGNSFSELLVGKKGILEHQGKRFVSFIFS